MRVLASLVSGIVFGLGLWISGMARPAKVIGFLDIFGSWDPSLAFVMAAAVGVATIGFRFVLAQPRPLLAARFHLPPPRAIDTRLVMGAVIFGAGWGLGGYCPGPALTTVALGGSGALVFVFAMLAGMAGALGFNRLRRAAASLADGATP